jgi:hypothetical protein
MCSLARWESYAFKTWRATRFAHRGVMFALEHLLYLSFSTVVMDGTEQAG